MLGAVADGDRPARFQGREEGFDVARCTVAATFELTQAASRALGRFETAASAAVPTGFDLDTTSILFFDSSEREVETKLRAYAVRNPGVSVNSELTFRQRESPLVPLVLAALGAMTVVTALGLALSLAGQAARSARDRRNLLQIGAPAATVAAIAVVEAMIVLGVAAVASTPIIAATLWSMIEVEQSAVLSRSAIGGTGLAMLAGIAVAGLAAGLGTRGSAETAE